MSLLLLFFLLVFCVPIASSPCKDAKDLKSCPSADFSSPEGSSKVIAANISAYSIMHVLCKKNPISSDWQAILIISSGQIHYMDIEYKELFGISGNDLAVENASKVLTGSYQLACYLDPSCVEQFSLGILGPWHCSSANFSLADGPSELLIANISTNSSVLALYKKDNFSSDWEHILSITDGLLSYIRKEYKGHFLMSENSLVIKNATEGLIGEYQLIGGDNETCVQQFFIEVAGSKAANISIYSIISIFVLGLALLTLGILYMHCKQKRRERNSNEAACEFTGVPDSENGSLRDGICRLQGTEMGRQSQEMQSVFSL